MDDLTLKARLAERESIEKRFVQNTVQRLNPWSEENRTVANRKQVIRSRQDPRFLQGTVDGWKSRQRAGKIARQQYRGRQAVSDQGKQMREGSDAQRLYNAQNPKASSNVAMTGRQNRQLLNATAPALEDPQMVDDGTGAPAPDPAAPPVPDAQPQQPAGGNVTAVPGAEGGGAAAGGAAAQPQGQQMEGMNMGNFLQAAQMFGDQNFRNQQLQMQRQALRQQDPAYQARVMRANRRANKEGGLLNAMTGGALNAITRARGERQLNRLDQSMKFASSDRADLEDLLLTKSAVRERDGTDRLRGIV